MNPSHSSVPNGARAESRPGALAVRFWLGFMLAYTAWAWAGLRPSYHWAGVARRWCCWRWCCGMRFAPWCAIRCSGWDCVLRVFAGAMANAGREQYFDVGYHRGCTPRRGGRAGRRPMRGGGLADGDVVFFRRGSWRRRSGAADVAAGGAGAAVFLVCQAGALALFGWCSWPAERRRSTGCSR